VNNSCQEFCLITDLFAIFVRLRLLALADFQNCTNVVAKLSFTVSESVLKQSRTIMDRRGVAPSGTIWIIP
jgi:hypothetical protein